MATRKTTVTTSETPVGFSLVAEPSDGVRRAPRASEADPWLPNVNEAFLASLGNPQRFTVADKDTVKRVKNLLATVRKTNKMGLKQSLSSDGKGGYILDFEAKPSATARSYTSKDVREWLTANGYDAGTGRISKEHRDAYKTAHGIKVAVVKVDAEN